MNDIEEILIRKSIKSKNKISLACSIGAVVGSILTIILNLVAYILCCYHYEIAMYILKTLGTVSLVGTWILIITVFILQEKIKKEQLNLKFKEVYEKISQLEQKSYYYNPKIRGE